MSSKDRSARALTLFSDYADMPLAERERALAELASRDPDLCLALQALLASDADAQDSLLDRSPAAVLASKLGRDAEADAPGAGPDARVGTHLGPWRIECRVARGGMGSVYEAQRDDGQYQQRVAIKCILAELATPALLTAFHDERNVLARLDHPGIAALIDGGVDDTGHPWFAMRYVDGIAIDRWCDQHRASVHQRVDLLLQACEALAYAHAQGVLHRDIKPSNLMVGDDGRVQLVDFGIASTFIARAGADRDQIALTREYAAPEARERGANAPATDLYALGVLSYRLLCGQWPTPLHTLRDLVTEAGSDEALPMDQLLDDAAPAIAEQRGVANLAALRRLLAGDLSAVVLKAVAQRPQDRYASVNEFAEELRRWREHRPLAIYGDRWLYRARKFARRHRLAVGVSVAVAISAALGSGLALHQHRIAVRETQATATVSRLFASTLGMATLSGLSSTPFSSKALLTKTERELRGLPLDDHPALYARGLATLARSYAVLGDYRHAEGLAGEAQRALGDRLDEDGFIAATRLSMLNNQAKHAEALSLARSRIEALDGRDDVQARRMRLTFGAELAKAEWGLADTTGAVSTIDALIAEVKTLPEAHSELEAELLSGRASFLFRLLRYEEAENDARRAERLARPHSPLLADDALELLVSVLGRRLSPDAVPQARLLVESRRRNLGAAHPKTALATIRLVSLHYPRPVNEDTKGALTLIENSYGHDNPTYGFALNLVAWAIAGDKADEVRVRREALDILQRTVGPHAEQTVTVRRDLGNALIELSRAKDQPTDYAEGYDLLRQAIAGKDRAGIPAPIERLSLIGTVAAAGDLARVDEAQIQIEKLRREASLPVRFLAQYVEHLDAQLLYLRGDTQEADRSFARAIEADRARLDNAPPVRSNEEYVPSTMLIKALTFRALHAYETCQSTQALEYLEQARRFGERAFGPDDAITRAARSYRDSLRNDGRMRDGILELWLSHTIVAAANRRALTCASQPVQGSRGKDANGA